MLIAIRQADIGEFVRRSDELGGPGASACEQYWQTLSFVADTKNVDHLDPFGDDYVAGQIELYENLSGRILDETNECSSIDVARHVAAANPYNHPSPGGLALHIQRLTRALNVASPPLGGRLLDMGCGWGLSSEIAAYCGLEVTAVDISPDFVRLVSTRAHERGLAITAQQGTFDAFSDDRQYDAILFYECLHHAVRAWTVIARMADKLTFDGKIVLAGEPINEIWWRSWGMRLDPLSLYCIRKFGWFETGWSIGFLENAFRRSGLTPRIEESDVTGYTVVADFSSQVVLGPEEIVRRGATGWAVDRDYLTSQGCSSVTLTGLEKGGRVRLALNSFRPGPLAITIDVNGERVLERTLSPGECVFNLDVVGPAMNVQVSSDLWCPDDELSNGDRRRIGVHLRVIGVVAAQHH